MIRFKTFITEMPYLSDIEKTKLVSRTGDKKATHGFTKLSSIGELDIYHKKDTFGDNDEAHTYRAVDRENRVHFHLETDKKENGDHAVVMVMGRDQSPIKAHDFYHHLITKHGVNIRSDTTQSHGGASIWKNLSGRSDLKVTHHSVLDNGNEIPLNRKNWAKNYGRNTYFRASKIDA